MARPKPGVLFERVDSNFRCEEILKAGEIYAVCYDGEPIHLRTYHKLISDKKTKYKNCSFTTAAPAYNLAQRLNKFFDSDKFSVYQMVVSKEIVSESEAKKFIKKRPN